MVVRPLTINGVEYPLYITDINIGILYVFGVVSIGVYGIMIGGWASNNKYALLGSLRASSQMISYEIAMGLAIIALIMTSGTLSVAEIVRQQESLEYRLSTIRIPDLYYLRFCGNQPGTI